MLLLLVMVVHPQKAMSAMAMAMDMDMDGVDTKDYADNTSAIIYVCMYIHIMYMHMEERKPIREHK